MSRTIAFQACRHGLGCSHLVANVATLLMQRGHRVGLWDSDPCNGGIRTLLGLDQARAKDPMFHWWLSPDAHRPHTLQARLQAYGPGTDPTPPGIYLPTLKGQFDPEGIQLRSLQAHYGLDDVGEVFQCLSRDLALDYWLIDNQPEMDNNGLVGLSLADTVTVIMQLDAYDFQRVAVILDVVQQLSRAEVWLVPNLVLPDLAAAVVQHNIEQAYGQPVAGVLFFNEEVIRLASSGIFCLHHPTHAMTQAMVAITHCLEQAEVRSDRASTEAQDPQQLWSSRPRMLMHLLDFPALERKLITILLRQGPAPIESLVQQSHAPHGEVVTAIARLVDQGWIMQDPITQQFRYRTTNFANPSSSDRSEAGL